VAPPDLCIIIPGIHCKHGAQRDCPNIGENSTSVRGCLCRASSVQVVFLVAAVREGRPYISASSKRQSSPLHNAFKFLETDTPNVPSFALDTTIRFEYHVLEHVIRDVLSQLSRDSPQMRNSNGASTTMCKEPVGRADLFRVTLGMVFFVLVLFGSVLLCIHSDRSV
jgi:hypothetical protein